MEEAEINESTSLPIARVNLQLHPLFPSCVVKLWVSILPLEAAFPASFVFQWQYTDP
jgi:hypothetical protein